MVHGILVLGITFAPEDMPQPRFESMEIILVQQESDAPDDAKVLAQANLEGGGEVAEQVSPSAPLPAPFPENEPEIAAPPPVAAQPPAKSAAESPEVITEMKAEPTEVLEQIAVESSEAEERLSEETEIKPDDPKPAASMARSASSSAASFAPPIIVTGTLRAASSWARARSGS